MALEKFLKNQRNLQNIHDKYRSEQSDDETVMMREVLAPAFKKLEGWAGGGHWRFLVRVDYRYILCALETSNMLQELSPCFKNGLYVPGCSCLIIE